MKHERTMIKTYTHQLNFVDVDVVGVVVSKNLQIRKNNFKNQYKQNVKHPSQILQTILKDRSRLSIAFIFSLGRHDAIKLSWSGFLT